jgi:hypothetical protein
LFTGEEGKEIAMSKNVNGIIRKLSAAQRKKIEARAAALIAEERPPKRRLRPELAAPRLGSESKV